MNGLFAYTHVMLGPLDKTEVSLRLYITLILLCISTSAGAFTNAEMARRVYSAVNYSEISATRIQRAEMASAIQAYWIDFDSKLPRLSPKEAEWVNGELNSDDSSRMNRAMSTSEYSLFALANIRDQCLKSTTELQNTYRFESFSDFEMFHWSKVAYCYHQSNESLSNYLRAAGLDTTVDVDDGHMLDSLILSRILTVIIPSAMADIMEWTLAPD